jgi:hypothetical protein
MQAMKWSPYDFTLLLDTDTYVCAHTLSDVWSMVQRFDLVATHAPFFYYEGRPPDESQGVWSEISPTEPSQSNSNSDSNADSRSKWRGESPFDIPASFVQLNTAVVAFARNQRVAAMLERALLVSERFLANNFLDQAILRHALWYTPEVRLYVLPATWQCRGAMDCDERQVQNYNSGNGHLHDALMFEGVSLQPCQILHTRGIMNRSLNIL